MGSSVTNGCTNWVTGCIINGKIKLSMDMEPVWVEKYAIFKL